jgi:hypothetical protein
VSLEWLMQLMKSKLAARRLTAAAGQLAINCPSFWSTANDVRPRHSSQQRRSFGCVVDGAGSPITRSLSRWALIFGRLKHCCLPPGAFKDHFALPVALLLYWPFKQISASPCAPIRRNGMVVNPCMSGQSPTRPTRSTDMSLTEPSF